MTIPLICLFLGALLPLLAKVPLSRAMAQEGGGTLGGYDNNHPRDQHARLTGWGRRSLAAHQNAYEAFPPFAAGVVVSLTLGADATWTSALCVVWVVSRVVYNVVYLLDWSSLRSLIWFVGFGSASALILLPLFSV